MNRDERAGDDASARELREADVLLEKADAFLKRHHYGTPPLSEENTSAEDDELPVLTEIVEKPSEQPFTDSLEAALEQRIEEWFAAELPHLVEREMRQLSRRLRHEALAQMRSSLMPELAATIEAHLQRETGFRNKR